MLICIIGVASGSVYMLNYSISPNPNRSDTASFFKEQFSQYPETRPWVDSLRRINALRDTFVIMPTGERHHAFYINRSSHCTALVLHGWRSCAIDMFFIGRLYDYELGYNVVLPDLHAHGLSEGDAVGMGCLDRKDMLHWMQIFQTDTMVVHGISMGAATTMMMSGEAMPKGVKDVRFIADCGYTSVWDEFSAELKNRFDLPPFPLMYTTSLLCKLCYGWSFEEASPIREVAKSPYPILFIHGNKDELVPEGMVHRLYDAKKSKKALWISDGASHAQSYMCHKKEYINKMKDFLGFPNE